MQLEEHSAKEILTTPFGGDTFGQSEHSAEGVERSDRDFCRFLTIAQGSNSEVEAQVTIAGDIGCLDPVTVAKLLDQTDHIGRMIRKLMQHRAASG